MTGGENKSIQVFISYRHVDHRVIDDLRNHLGWLENSENIAVFDDRQIVAGDEWDKLIRRELDHADIVILVVTAAFMRSPYCARTELRQALEMRLSRGVRIIPIIAETCDWEAMPLKSIAALPKDQANNLKPLNKWGRNRDVALTQIALHVRRNVDIIRAEKENGEVAQSQASEIETSVPNLTFELEIENPAETSPARTLQPRSAIEAVRTDDAARQRLSSAAEGPPLVDERVEVGIHRVPNGEGQVIETGDNGSGIKSAAKVVQNWMALAISIGVVLAVISVVAANVGGFQDTICDKINFTWCERPCTLDRFIKEGCK